MSWPELKAGYRFYDNKKVTSKKLMLSHYEKTIERFDNLDVVLKLQDTTELNFTSQKCKKDLGYLANSKCSGLMVHTTLSVTENGLPIGLLNQQVWARDNNLKGKTINRHNQKIEDKESYRWLESLTETDKMFKQMQVMIGDIESDIYDLFVLPRKENSHLLIRSAQNRLIDHIDNKLFTALDNSQPKGNLSLDVGRKKGQSQRVADLTVKYERFKIKAPKNIKKEIDHVELNVILVDELNNPESIDGIKWILLTTLEINSFEDALKYVRWYSYRWLIERFHYVLKSGCQIENLQLDSAEKIQKALSMYSILACKLLNITYSARKDPLASCESFLEKREWQILYLSVHKTKNLPKQTPNLKEFVLWISQLGGFIARKSDGLPGVKNLWRGYRRFSEIIQSIQLITSLSLPINNIYG